MIGGDMEIQDLTPMVSQFFYGPPDPHRDSSFKRSVGPTGKGLCPFWNPMGLFFDQ